VRRNKCGCRAWVCFCCCGWCWLGGIFCNGDPCYCWDVEEVCACGYIVDAVL